MTLIDANHCPGAVQFLFQVPKTTSSSTNSTRKTRRASSSSCKGHSSKGTTSTTGATYLHCGDMRYCPDMLQWPALAPARGCDGVFLDTTYCNPKHCFPPQVRVCSCQKPCMAVLECIYLAFCFAPYGLAYLCMIGIKLREEGMHVLLYAFIHTPPMKICNQKVHSIVFTAQKCLVAQSLSQAQESVMHYISELPVLCSLLKIPRLCCVTPHCVLALCAGGCN